MEHEDTTSRSAALRRQEQIDKDIEKFLACGGAIEVVPTIIHTAADVKLPDYGRKKTNELSNLMSAKERGSIDSPA